MSDQEICPLCNGAKTIPRMVVDAAGEPILHLGKPRYQRWDCECLLAEKMAIHLGPFISYEPFTETDAPELIKLLPEKNVIVVVEDLDDAKRVISTRLRRAERPWLSLTGLELMGAFFRHDDDDEEAYHRGFPQYRQLYLMLDYYDGPNKRLAASVVEVLGLRAANKMHAWLFIPSPLGQVANRMVEGHCLNKLGAWTTLDLTGRSGRKASAAAEIHRRSTISNVDSMATNVGVNTPKTKRGRVGAQLNLGDKK